MKNLMFFIAAIVLIAGCQKNPGVDENLPVTIKLSAGINAELTRSPIETSTFPENTNDVFRVSAFQGQNAPAADGWAIKASGDVGFENLPVNSGVSALTLSETRYYPTQSSDKLYFYAFTAFSPEHFTYAAAGGTVPPEVEYKISGQEDIMYDRQVDGIGTAGTSSAQKHPAFNFKHLLKKVVFKVKGDESFPTSGVKLTNIEVVGANTRAVLNVGTGELGQWSDPALLSLPPMNAHAITGVATSVPGALMFEPGIDFKINVYTSQRTYKDIPVELVSTTGVTAGKAGVNHEVTLTFQQDGIIVSADITEWENAGNTSVKVK